MNQNGKHIAHSTSKIYNTPEYKQLLHMHKYGHGWNNMVISSCSPCVNVCMCMCM